MEYVLLSPVVIHKVIKSRFLAIVTRTRTQSVHLYDSLVIYNARIIELSSLELDVVPMVIFVTFWQCLLRVHTRT